jgi:hypothetical protein
VINHSFQSQPTSGIGYGAASTAPDGLKGCFWHQAFPDWIRDILVTFGN